MYNARQRLENPHTVYRAVCRGGGGGGGGKTPTRQRKVKKKKKKERAAITASRTVMLMFQSLKAIVQLIHVLKTSISGVM